MSSKNDTNTATLRKEELYALPIEEIAKRIPEWDKRFEGDDFEAEYHLRTGTHEEKLDEIFEELASILVQRSMAGMVIKRGLAALGSILYQIAVREPSEDLPTMAVTIKGDGVVRMIFNPTFTVQLESTAVEFVLSHEAQHVLLAHLLAGSILNQDEYWTIATEATINYRVKKLFPGLREIPGGGVDPKNVYDRYRRKSRELEQSFVSIEELYSTDRDCYAHLKRTQTSLRGYTACQLGGGDGQGDKCPTCGGSGSIPQPGSQGDEEEQGQGGGDDAQDGQGSDGEGSQSGSGGGSAVGSGKTITCPTCHGSGEGGGNRPYDPTTLKNAVEGALSTAIQDALAGDQEMRKTLEDLEAATPAGSKVWGNLGMGALRGETAKGRAHPMWSVLLRDAIKSKLSEEGDRPRYNRKTVGIPTRPGFGRPLSPIGRVEITRPLIAIDTSGSMSAEILNRISKMIGMIENAEPEWIAFDAVAWPFNLGEPLQGGGGTSFSSIVDYINDEMEEEPDAIIVVTDGYAPRIEPALRDRWIWLITEGGDPWPQEVGMHCIQVDDFSAQLAGV